LIEVLQISDLERDAVAEIANIAVGRAAASLRQIVGHEILMSVPSVDILSREAAARVVAKPGAKTFVAVCQSFDGPFSGRALLIFPEANSLALVQAILGRELPVQDIVEIEDEALAETGNIILNNFVATMANVFKRGLKMSLPSVMRGAGPDLFERPAAEDDLVLFLYINFEISQKEIRGYLALVMDLPSLETLQGLVRDYLATVAGKDQDHGVAGS
jgi:chemotaxis protein CheC